ncbi:MAG TPA: phytanoyl-CoA dioxygenase family protein [Planctomycetota bacterium]|nr:phytanoyl-CoA dioxygenase family protein [Planctomycetota bacterium]
MAARLGDADHARHAEEVLRDGQTILRGHFPETVLRAWHTAFTPLLDAHIQREGMLRNRGTERYYVTLPFTAPFADERIFADADVLAVVERLVGADFTMGQLATDTPLIGSEYQEIHRDAPPLFPEWGRETPPFQLAVNFPLVDVTLDNGPFEVAPATHMLAKDEGMARLERGEVALQPMLMSLGDVMIRDVRGLHRGTPNRTAEPRPMCVIGYSRRWLLRPEVSIRIPRAMYDGLSQRARAMLRHNPIVDDLAAVAPDTEVYQAYAY